MNRPKPKPAMGGERRLYPNAPFTSPGGMSQAELRLELAEHHHVPMAESKAMTWKEQIAAVCEGRLDREGEKGIGPRATPETIAASKSQAALTAVEMDADELLAEQTERSMESEWHADKQCDRLDAHSAHDWHNKGIGMQGCAGLAEEMEDDDDFSDLEFDDETGCAHHDGDGTKPCSCGRPLLPTPEPKYDANLLTHEMGVLVTTEPSTWTKSHDGDYTPPQPPLVDLMFTDEEDAGFEDEVSAMLTAEKHVPTPLFIGMPDTFDYIFDGHYGASPSGAERWAHCTASLESSRVFLETLTPNQQKQFASSGTAARQGTTAHAAGEAELLLMLGLITQPEYDAVILDLTINPDLDESYDTDMAEHLNAYVDYVKQLHDAGRPLFIEERVRAKVWLTGTHDGEVHEVPGSADCGAFPSKDEPNVITVADLKFGNGIDVTVDGNPQTRIYGLGFLAKYVEEGGDLDDIDTMEYVIVQPRLGGIKVWQESLDDLFAWRDEVLAPALTAALYGQAEGATFSPSEDACQWCPARGGCPALIEDRMSAGASMFDEVMEAEVSGNPIDPMSMSNERLGEVLAQITAVADLKDDIKAEVQRRLHRGIDVPLHELVNYTPSRSWKEGAKEKIKEAVEAGTIPSIYKPPAIMTPTQASTMLKEQEDALEWVSKLIDVHDVVPVVGPDAKRRAARGDRRKSWNGRAPEDMFGDESTDADPVAASIEEMFPA